MKSGIRTSALCVLIAVGSSVVAHAEPKFNDTKRDILSSEAGMAILKWHVAGGELTASEWAITEANLDRLEVVLSSEMTKRGFGKISFETREFYRQYMPALWRGHHLIVVNGFYSTVAELFPNNGIDPDQWKHELVSVFGGGCSLWHAAYVVEQDRLIALKGSSAGAKIVCNAPR